VLLRHPAGYMTTYAHLERIFVARDSIAAKGDVIGTVGTTGGLVTPQLHFEIRKGADALAPKKYLAKR
jgi:murein DD-endopeptidase MepM/ murein hydrolase activator NlpD